MSNWKINLKEQTATSINVITFKLTETEPGEYEGVCLNASQIPPDDLDDVILGRMIREAGVFYKMGLERQKDSKKTPSSDQTSHQDDAQPQKGN